MTAKRPAPARNACGDKIGTDAGYQRHRMAGEDACPPCKAAHRVKGRHAQAGRRADGRNDDAGYSRAARAALAYLWRTDPATAERIEAEAGYRRRRPKKTH